MCRVARALIKFDALILLCVHAIFDRYGFGNEDALTHLLNLVWPNIFETSPHVINAVMDAVGGLATALGPAKMLS